MRSPLILLSLLFSPASVVVPQAGDVVIPPAAIVQVVCFGVSNKGVPYIRSGTAFRVGNGLLLSANHVTAGPAQCFIGKEPIKIAYASATSDFSMLTGDDGASLTVDCGGFVKGRRYVALGFARGWDRITSIELAATGQTDKGLAILQGLLTVIPGQSGGPIVDAETGKVVGTVDVENFEEGMSGSVALKDTPVCKKPVA